MLPTIFGSSRPASSTDWRKVVNRPTASPLASRQTIVEHRRRSSSTKPEVVPVPPIGDEHEAVALVVPAEDLLEQVVEPNVGEADGRIRREARVGQPDPEVDVERRHQRVGAALRQPAHRRRERGSRRGHPRRHRPLAPQVTGQPREVALRGRHDLAHAHLVPVIVNVSAGTPPGAMPLRCWAQHTTSLGPRRGDRASRSGPRSSGENRLPSPSRRTPKLLDSRRR